MIEPIMKHLQLFLTKLVTSGSLELETEEPPGDYFFWNRDEGGIYLTAQERIEYLDLLNELSERRDVRARFSRNGIDEILRSCVFEAVDIPASRAPRNSEERITDAVKLLEQELAKAPRNWIVAVRVEGLKLGTRRRWRFGRVVFRTGEDLLAEIEEKSNWYYELSKDRLTRDLQHTAYAQVGVTANDSEAAKLQGRNAVRRVLNVLNFYVDLVNNPGLNLALSEFALHRPKVLDVVVVFHEDGSLGPVSSSVHGPMTALAVDLLEAYREKDRLQIAYLEELLSLDNVTELQEQALTGIQWIGRATIQPVREEAFALYFVGLEALLGGSNYSRVNTAILLAQGEESPKQAKERIERLYRIRSAIVHSGRFYVAESDLMEARYIVKTSVFCYLKIIEANGFSRKNELDDWFATKRDEYEKNYPST